MPKLKILHERVFVGKQLQSLKVYEDPFGETDLCVELSFVDGEVACLSIGPGRPKIVSSDLCRQVSHNNDKPRRVKR